MKRILEIEGLRAYLALWVLFAHVMAASGYPHNAFSGIALYLRSGRYAVDVFIIISGFVIFYLLDNKKENYLTFIIRRFFRIWPLFIVLFLLSIPFAYLRLSNCVEIYWLYYPSAYCSMAKLITSWLQNTWTHIALHIPMLHGVVPQKILPYAPTAFLAQAWSITLEWQFYLIAPLVFNYVTKSSRFRVAMISVLTLFMLVFNHKLPYVQGASFLPMRTELFYLGCFSYFIFRELSNKEIKVRFLPVGCVVAIWLFLLADLSMRMLPISIWVIFFCQLIDAANPRSGNYTTAFSWIFNNRLAQYLGKISYSLYLSHVIIISLFQKLLLVYFSTLSQREHFIVLAILSFIGTVLVSSILYYFIEAKGMKIGRKLATKIGVKKIKET